MSEIHVIPCGTLRVGAGEMIRPIGADAVGKEYPVEDNGTMKLAMNALLVIHLHRCILIDPGCADFLPRKLAEQYGLEMEMSLEEQLQPYGIVPEDITDVLFTHLHFDHGSGAFKRVPGKIIKRFPFARYHVLKAHYEYALQPDSREADVFFTRLFHSVGLPVWLDDWQEEWITFKVFQGHTRGMVVPLIYLGGVTTCYLSDLVPMALFLKEDIFSGYDLDPVIALREKQVFLNEIKDPVELIFFHDLLDSSMIYP